MICKSMAFPQFDATETVVQATASQQRSLKNLHDRTLLTSKVDAMRTKSFSKDCAERSKSTIAQRKSPVRLAKGEPRYDPKCSSDEDLTIQSSDEDYNPVPSWSDDESLSEEDYSYDTNGNLSKTQKRQRVHGQTRLVGPLKAQDIISGNRGDAGKAFRSRESTSSEVGVHSISSEEDTRAILRFSPPRTKSPCKKPYGHVSRPVTPPISLSKSVLGSPQKQTKIPPTPHHQDHEEFWDAGVINSWNDQHSPRKPINSPQKSRKYDFSHDGSRRPESPSPQKADYRSPSRKDPSKAKVRKDFERTKDQIARDFLQELDTLVTDGEISRLAASTGGVKLIWSRKLNSTAGRANWRREVGKKLSPPNLLASSEELTGSISKEVQYRHHASIELAEKVIDHETRLLNVIAHEYCHLANFMISGVKDQPHGTSFKRWAKLVTNAFADRDIRVTTKHDYEINYKYAWLCTNDDCAVKYSRHSRSIDPRRHTCGKCKSRLVQIRPVPRNGKDKTGEKQGGEGYSQSRYQMFVKENYNVIRKELGEKSPMKDVMKEVSSRYRAQKERLPTRSGEHEQNKKA